MNENPELALLGCVLIDNSCLDDISLKPEYFTDNLNRRLYEEMLVMRREGKGIDTLTLSNHVADKYNIPVGVHLSECLESVVSLGFVADYAGIIKRNYYQKAEQRIRTNPDLSTDELIKQLLALQNDTSEAIFATLKQGIEIIGERIKRIRETGFVPGIDLGFDEIDKKVSINNGYLVTIAARPGVGKTMFGINVAYNVACAGKKVAFISLEMKKEEITGRMLTIRTGIPDWKMKRGMVTEEEFDRIRKQYNELGDLPVIIDDDSKLTPTQLRSKLRVANKDGKIDLLVIDYVGLMNDDFREKDPRLRLVNITRELKSIAKDFDIPIIMLAQLNANLDKRQNREPILSDIKESASIVEDSDVVLAIYNDEIIDESSNKINLKIVKNRHGQVGKLVVGFDKENCKMYNIPSEHFTQQQAVYTQLLKEGAQDVTMASDYF